MSYTKHAATIIDEAQSRIAHRIESSRVEAYNDQIHDMAHRIASLIDDVTYYEGQRDEARNDLTDAREARQSLQESYDASLNEAHTLRESLARAERDRVDYATYIDDLTGRVDRDAATIKSLTNSNLDLSVNATRDAAQIDHLTHMIHSHEATISNMSHALADTEIDRNEARESLARVEGYNDDLLDRCDKIRDDNDALRAEIASLRDDLTKSRNDLTKAREFHGYATDSSLAWREMYYNACIANGYRAVSDDRATTDKSLPIRTVVCGVLMPSLTTNDATNDDASR